MKVLEQEKFFRCQFDFIFPDRNPMAVCIDRDAFISQHAGLERGRRGALQQGTDPGNQLLGAEWLGDVVVSAMLEARKPIGLVAARREHDDGDLRCREIRPHRFADIHTAEARQHEVEDDQLDPVGPQMTHDLGAVAKTVCLMPGVREIPDDQIRDVAIVFHN